jgi:hypothetical protein
MVKIALNWYGPNEFVESDDARFRRFILNLFAEELFNQTPIKNTISTLTTLANMDEDDAFKDSILNDVLLGFGDSKFQDLDWRDYK